MVFNPITDIKDIALFNKSIYTLLSNGYKLDIIEIDLLKNKPIEYQITNMNDSIIYFSTFNIAEAIDKFFKLAAIKDDNKEKEILKRYFSQDTKSIFGFMYGNRYINTNNGKVPDKIIEIDKKSLKLSSGCFIYVWGYPGPDANTYYFKDYGETWAFSEKEIRQEED
jgi:hypothetical protein